MNRFIYLFLLSLLTSFNMQAQSITIVSPALSPPYEVAPGTEVTFQWDYFGEAPTVIFSHNEEPILPGFGTDPIWTEHAGVISNGDGTFNITITIDEPQWIFGAYYASFIGQWSFSNFININTASDVVISGNDLLLCNDGMDTEVLSIMDTFTNYQWYMDGNPIMDAAAPTYSVSQPGAYYVSATYEGEVINSNTLNLSFIDISLTGALNENGTEVVLTSTAGMDSYQWLSGVDESSLNPIASATTQTYNATISTDLTYYAAEATINGCTVQSVARPIVSSFFMEPVIMVAADSNSFDVVCEGTDVTLSVTDTYDTYKWLRDGQDAFNSSNSTTLSQGYQEGNYSIEVSSTEWPEITLTSDEFNLNFQDVIQPIIIGVENYEKYCPGEALSATLGDEGYNYTWYFHDGFNNYTEDDIIDVDGSTLNFTFDAATYLTVVGEFQGCSSNRSLFLESYENSNMYLNTEDYNQEYLCTDSTNIIFLPEFTATDYENFQWFADNNGTFEAIADATTAALEISEPGIYQLQASIIACPSVVITSNEKSIFDYTEREMFIWSTAEKICVGEEVTLNISAGNSWSAIQWFEEDIVIGNQGYEKTYIPMAGAGSESSQVVSEFQTYLVKAKHNSCPNGLKTTSNIIGIRPLVNPTITPDPNYGISSWKLSPYDSIANYIFCSQEPVTLSLDGDYDSYSWYTTFYAGDDDYELGNLIDGANGTSIDINADVDWYTAVVDSAGCIGYSDPILIDTWVFLPPAIASYNNSELCEEGDSTLLHLGFPGEWDSFEWYLNGNPIPDSNNDTLYATQPGTYVLNANPSVCPQFTYSSGVGPTVSYLYADILENDSLIYALPELGFYTYQWYYNGEPIPSGPTPWVLRKDELLDGEYTVAVSNEDCTVLSDPYVWIINSISGLNHTDIDVYPNPTNDLVFIEGIETVLVDHVRVYNLLGMPITTFIPLDNKIEIDLSTQVKGLYIIDIHLKNGESYSWKVNRL